MDTAENPVESLQDEAACPICLEYFEDPVIIDCGHNFCRTCISQCWERSDTDPSCPQCRETVQQKILKPNRQLANIVEIAKRLTLQAAKGSAKAGICEEHQEALKLFCEEDQTCICLVCHLSWTHRTHTVVPIQEAAQEYKEKIQAHLKMLKEKREKLLENKLTREKKSQEYLKQTQTERQKVVVEFKQLQQFLEEQEKLLLAQLEKLDKEILKRQKETCTKISQEISHLTELIHGIEGKYQKPASEFLQDIRRDLNRCEKENVQPPVEISPELGKKLSNFSQKTIALVKTLRKFKDTLPFELETKRGQSLGAHRQVNVTLDPATVHPELVLSEDRKHVIWTEIRQDLPNNPERFDCDLCVLGSEGFTSGRHCWEVEVGTGGYWAVGVARESVRRKGRISLSPEGGIWAVERWRDQFQALTSPETSLPLRQVPSRIQVCLDCERGQVMFLDAGDEALIFIFPPASLPVERIHPWLWLGAGSRLQLCP